MPETEATPPASGNLCPRVCVAAHGLQLLSPDVGIILRRHDRRMPSQRLNRS